MNKRTSTDTHYTPLGLFLFFVYLLLYGGFVGLNAFAPSTMETTPLAGVNLAILYGFGLILSALALAIVYGVFGASHEPADTPDKETKPDP